MTLEFNSKILTFGNVCRSKLSPELRFLLSCLRQTLDQTTVHENKDTGLGEINWNKFLSLAKTHRLIPILYPYRASLAGQGMPGQLGERMRPQFIGNMNKAMALLAELTRVAEVLAQRGITVFPLKGSLLALQLYGDIARRHAGDLDILVESAQVEKAWQILHDLGYQCTNPACGLHPGQFGQYKVLSHHGSFWQATRRIKLELHWRLLGDRHTVRNNDTSWFDEKLSYLKVGNLPLPCMKPDRLLLYLCLHGSIHFWARLFWLYDVAKLLQQNRDLDWHEIIEEAKELGCLRSLLLGTALAHVLLDVQVPHVFQHQWDLDSALPYLCRQSYPYTDHAFSPKMTFAQSMNFLSFAIRLRGNYVRAIPLIVQKFFLPGYELPYVPLPLLPIYFMLKPFLWARFQNNLAHPNSL